MQRGVTVVLATVWLVVAVDVGVGVAGEAATRHPATHLTFDQYSPPPPRRHPVYGGADVTEDSEDQDHGVDRTLEFDILPRLSILDDEPPRRPFSVDIGGDRVLPREQEISTFKDIFFTSARDKEIRKSKNKGIIKKEEANRKSSDPRPFFTDDSFVADDTFQDQGPGSVEIYKLDLFNEKTLLNPTPSVKPPVRGKSKAPKKTGRSNWKTKTPEYKSTSPKSHYKQSNFFEEQRTEIPRNRDSFDVGGVPELQVGCEGLEASSHKLKRSADAQTADKDEDVASTWLYMTPATIDLNSGFSSDDSYEEVDELVKMRKMEEELKKKRGDMNAKLDEFFTSFTTADVLPVRGDLANAFVDKKSVDSMQSSSKEQVQIQQKETVSEIIVPGSGLVSAEEKDEDKAFNSKDSRALRRKLLWAKDSAIEEIGEYLPKRSKRSNLWGFGENEGAVSSDEIHPEEGSWDSRRQEEARWRPYQQRNQSNEVDRIREEYERLLRQREREEQERQRRVQQGHDPGRSILNSWEEEERRKQEHARRLEEENRKRLGQPSRNQTEEEERLKKLREDIRRRNQERWQEEQRRRQEEEKRRQEMEEQRRRPQQPDRNPSEEEKRRLYEEEIRRREYYRRQEEEERRRAEEEARRHGARNRTQEESRRKWDSYPRNKTEDEETRRRTYEEEMRRRQEEERRRQEEIHRRQEEEHRRQEEEHRRQEEEHRRREQEEQRRRQLEEQRRPGGEPHRRTEDRERYLSPEDRRSLEERRREWLLKRRQEEEERRRHDTNQSPPSNLMRPDSRYPYDTRSNQVDEERRLREQQIREQKLRDYIQRNQPINSDRTRYQESRRPPQNTTSFRDYDEEYRRREEEHRRRLEQERKLQEYIRRNQPVVPSNETYPGRNWYEERRTIEAARQYDRSRYPSSDNTRQHGPSAPTNIDPRSYADAIRREEARRLEEEKRREEARRLEAERRKSLERERQEIEERRREAARREAEMRRLQSQRYEDERRRQEAARSGYEQRKQELIDEQNRRAMAGRTRTPEVQRPGYDDRRHLQEHRRAQETSVPANFVRDDKRRAMQEERMRQEQERRRQEEERRRYEAQVAARNNDRRRQEEDRLRELKRKEEHVKGMKEHWRRQEEARLNSLPVNARIIIRPGQSSGSTSPVVISRGGFANEIDFPGINPDRGGIQVSKFPMEATSRPPAKGPSPCVWAVVQCCTNMNRLVSCFESMGCPGISFDPNPCRRPVVEAARREVMEFYAQAERDQSALG